MKKVTVNNKANSTNNMVNENKNFKEVKTMKANNNSNNNTFNTIVEQPKTYLATTKTGHKIYICDETIEHMKAHSDVSMEHIKEAIEENETYQGPFEIRMISLGYIIGKDHCVEIAEDDPDVHPLYRKGRAGTTPVTFSGETKDTSLITIGICLDQDLKDTLFTAFYGQLAPREPWDPSLPEKDRIESEEFWKNHAIVATPDEIDWERSDNKFMPKKQEEEEMDNTDSNDETITESNEQEEREMEKKNENPLADLCKEIQEKMHMEFNFADYAFVDAVVRNKYTKEWLSVYNEFVLPTVTDAVLEFNAALDGYRGGRNSVEYDNAGSRECCKIEYALTRAWWSDYNFQDIAPFIEYCEKCWIHGDKISLEHYDVIRRFFESNEIFMPKQWGIHTCGYMDKYI